MSNHIKILDPFHVCKVVRDHIAYPAVLIPQIMLPQIRFDQFFIIRFFRLPAKLLELF